MLMTPSSQHIDGIVAEVLEEVTPVGRCVNTGLLRNCYICRPCFRAMERIIKLRKDSLTSFQDLCNNARNAVHFLPLVESADEEVINQPPPAKRRRLLPQVAPVLPCSSTETSPAVSVRFII